MRAAHALGFLVFLLLAWIIPGPFQSHAQERGVELDKILRPLPEFDPFDKPPAGPEFFPDETDKRARDVLIDSLTNNHEALKQNLDFFKNKDAQLKRERGTVSGLTDGVQDLVNSTIQDRERYLEEQRKLLSSSSSPQHKKLLESTLNNDELTKAEDLARKSEINRWAGVLNTLLSSVDLLGVVSGSYIGAAVDSVLNQLLLTGHRNMTVEERRSLALYIEYLKRNPDDPKNAEIWKKVEALDRKKRKELVQKQLKSGGDALKKGDLARAGFHYEVAALIDPASEEAGNEIQRLKELEFSAQENRRNALSVAAPSGSNENPEENRYLKELLYALTQRKTEEISAYVAQIETRYAGQPLAAAAGDARAVAYEISGQHAAAAKLLQEIARSSSSPRERKRAEILLSSQEYHLLGSFEKARTDRQLDTIKFVLLGDDFLKKNLLMGAAPLIAHGAAGASTLGAASVILLGTNLLGVLSSNPISSRAVLDKGLAYIRNHPESPDAREVYRVLAEAYEQAGMLDNALTYYEMSGAASEKKIAELKEKTAKAFVAAADKSQDRGAKESYLTAVLDSFPESAAAQEATRKLALLAKAENQGLKVSKQFLMEHPELYGPKGLRLKPSLFDRNLTNMELADSGINLVSDREVLLHYQTPWGIQSRSYSLDRQAMDNFLIALRQKNYDVAVQDVDTRSKGTAGGLKGLPAAIARGEWARKASESEEADLTLLREAAGPAASISKVLDHQLLTETERDPSKRYSLPPIAGSISGSGVQLSGSMPAGIWGDR
ncbi:MAG: tetratricopeptide repeat protein, partial [Candidatus Binatia bacterium]